MWSAASPWSLLCKSCWAGTCFHRIHPLRAALGNVLVVLSTVIFYLSQRWHFHLVTTSRCLKFRFILPWHEDKSTQTNGSFTRNNDFRFKLENVSFWPNFLFLLKVTRKLSCVLGAWLSKSPSVEHSNRRKHLMKKSSVRNILPIF